jgi:ABC-2 type transport system ATP-binding protein
MKLRLSDAAFTYPGSATPALRDVGLEIDTSAVTVLVGNNGAGKSTLIRLLTGQLLGYAGKYTLDGIEPDIRRGELLAKSRFGYVPDVPVLDPKLTGLELIQMVGSFRGLTGGQVLEEVKRYGELFDLGDWLGNMTCDKYSKGMRKKISLAAGFLGSPAYVFLDEPFDGLDPIAIYNLKRYLKERREDGRGSLLSSHMLDAAEKVADDLIILKGGSLAYHGSYLGLLESRPQGTGLEEIYFEYFAK